MRRERRRLWVDLIFAVPLTVLVLVSCGCAADVHTVCPSGCDYTSIQAAIDAAQTGDTIEVRSGTYYEHVNVSTQLILRGIDIGGGKPVVDAGGFGSAITLSHAGIVLDGFTAINAGRDYTQAGILITSTDCSIINNTVSNNYYGIYLSSASNNTLRGNIAHSNIDVGICLRFASNNNNLTGNTASNNYYGNGIYLDSSSNNNLMDNSASNQSNGIYLASSSNNNNLTGNTVSNNYLGMYLRYSSYNVLTGNAANANDNIGIRLSYSSRNSLTDNAASNNNNGIRLDSSCFNSLTNNTASNNSNGIQLSVSCFNNTLTNNTASNNSYYGIYLDYSCSNNLMYNNYFDNALNAHDTGTNIWNITRTHGTNSIGGDWLGGNYWSDYRGEDKDDDGLGETLLPYNATGGIKNGGDFLPGKSEPSVSILLAHVFVGMFVEIRDHEDAAGGKNAGRLPDHLFRCRYMVKDHRQDRQVSLAIAHGQMFQFPQPQFHIPRFS